MKIFMQLDSFCGESQDRLHLCWIDVQKFSQSSGKGGEKQLHVTLKTGRTSDELAAAMAYDKKFAKARIEVLNEAEQVVQVKEFRNLTVVSVEIGGATQTVSFEHGPAARQPGATNGSHLRGAHLLHETVHSAG